MLTLQKTADDENSDTKEEKSPLWSPLQRWCLYVVAMCFYHNSEFYTTAYFNPTALKADSFMMVHSNMYTIAVVVSCFEFWFVRPWIYNPLIRSLSTTLLILSDDSKFYWFLNTIPSLGCVLLFGGLGLRILAMMTCGTNFHHLIQSHQKDDHLLVTHGIYKYLRHPSYTGWFYFTIGTQILLGNPLTTIGYGITGLNFFQRRIKYEEYLLSQQYPGSYAAYCDQTYIGIPFLSF